MKRFKKIFLSCVMSVLLLNSVVITAYAGENEISANDVIPIKPEYVKIVNREYIGRTYFNNRDLGVHKQFINEPTTNADAFYFSRSATVSVPFSLSIGAGYGYVSFSIGISAAADSSSAGYVKYTDGSGRPCKPGLKITGYTDSYNVTMKDMDTGKTYTQLKHNTHITHNEFYIIYY